VGAANTPLLTKLLLPGESSEWEKIGFAPRDGSFQVGQVTCAIGTTEPSWAFDIGGVGPDRLSGILTEEFAARPSNGGSLPQPNGAFKIDHVVVVSDQPSQTKAAFEEFGLVAKGARSVGSGNSERTQCFFWSGELLIELVGPAVEQQGGSPCARIWGVTFVVAEFAALLALGDGLVSGPRDAVQAGRQIATVTRQQEVGIELAFISPHVKGSAPKTA